MFGVRLNDLTKENPINSNATGLNNADYTDESVAEIFSDFAGTYDDIFHVHASDKLVNLWYKCVPSGSYLGLKAFPHSYPWSPAFKSSDEGITKEYVEIALETILRDFGVTDFDAKEYEIEEYDD